MGPFAGWRPLTLMSEVIVPGLSYIKRDIVLLAVFPDQGTRICHPGTSERRCGPVHIQLPLRGTGAQRLKGVLCRGLLLNRLRAAEMAAPTTRYWVRCCSGHPRLTGSPERGAADVLANCIALSRLKGQAAPLHCVARPYPHKALRLCGVPFGLRGRPRPLP